jgi:hypothetical protein
MKKMKVKKKISITIFLFVFEKINKIQDFFLGNFFLPHLDFLKEIFKLFFKLFKHVAI